MALLKRYATTSSGTGGSRATSANTGASFESHDAVRALCKALFSLGSGNSDSQKKLYPVKPLLMSILNNKQLPDDARLAAKEADVCIQVR